MNWSTKILPCNGNPCQCNKKATDRDMKIDNILGNDLKTPYLSNNHNLRSPNILFELTSNEISSYKRALDDILYFSKIVSKYTLYEIQKNVLKDLQENRFNLIVNSRQSGMSMILAIKSLHKSLSKDKKILIYVCDDKLHMMNRIKDLYQIMPFYLKPGISNWGSNKISFDNGSSIEVNKYSPNNLLGGYDLIILDDFDYIDPKNSIIIHIIPIQLSSISCELIISSIPNGTNKFYNMFINDNTYNKNTIHWSQVNIENRDDTWKNDMINLIGVESFYQEYENMFKGSKEWNRHINLTKLIG